MALTTNNGDIVLNPNGNVGIGTTNPSSKLEISNNSASSANTTLLTLKNGNGTGDLGGTWSNNTSTNIDFVFTDDNANFTPQGRIKCLNGTQTNDGMDSEGAGNLCFYTGIGSGGAGGGTLNEIMRLTYDEKVGIGITDPKAKLHVYVDNDTNLTLVEILCLERHCDDFSTNANAEGAYISLKIDDDNASLGEVARISWRGDNADAGEDSGRLGFWTTNDDSCTEKLTITKEGDVGIGITDPKAKLHVYVDNDTNLTLVEILCLERHCDDFSTNANAEGAYISLKIDDDNASLGEVARISWRGDNADAGEDSGRLGFWTTNDDSCTEKLTITKEGDVGIGITTPSSKLDVNGDINVNGNITALNLDITGATTTIHTDTYTTESLHIQSSGSDAVALKITHDTTNHDIMEVNNSSGVQIFTIDSTGNVGIGITSPVYKLDVDGVMRLGRNDLLGSHGKLIFGKKSSASSSRTATIGYNDTYEFCIADGSDTDGGQLKIAYSAPENTIYCKGNGDVGIGTNTPSHKLDIYGGNLVIRTAQGENGDASIYLGTPHTSAPTLYKCAIIAEGQGDFSRSKLNFCLSEGGNTSADAVTLTHSRMCIDHTGNVGIGLGSTNPTQKLHIQSANPQILIGDSSNGSGQIYFGNSGHGVGRKTGLADFTDGNDTVLYTVGSGGTGLKTSGGYLKLSSGGNVGIGTTSPGYKLDVNGTFNCTSLTVGGDAFTGGGLWSTTSPSTTTSDIFYNDSTSITGSAYPQGSLVTISGSISDNALGSKMGLIVQHSNRTQGLGIGFNGISQCGSAANLHLYLRAKGTGTTKIGSSGGIGLDVSDSRVGIATNQYISRC